MKRHEITASSIAIGLLVLAASCLPASAVEIYIDVESDREAPWFLPVGAPPHREWGHAMPLLDVQPLGNKQWRLRTAYPDEWGCAIFWVVEGFVLNDNTLPTTLPSTNMIRFGECPDPPLPKVPVSEPSVPVLLGTSTAVGALALRASRRRVSR